ncbi:MAG: CusA/CzcA family heavy metal efflux RND transporter [Bacteroidetes bacterium]|nr:CusA/CzcA family heavy metal efflux RND transporter [Bacteroidota bacterium]
MVELPKQQTRLKTIITFSLRYKTMVLLATASIALFGLYALFNLPIGAVPDVTTNQVQVITTTRNLSTADVERFITQPVEIEMANLPGLVELRSVSKFGLSVVTVVFDDRMGTYLPRQLIAERIQAAVENIPQGFGSPFMGPISTGLGEIYQYILEVDPEYQHLYTATDLRTIQDWVVKRQLSGIPGVVEVNTWGGLLKQYEVAVNPVRLRAAGVSITEIFDALERNNSLAGAGYIEKNQQAYFIRSEGLIENLDELREVVVARHGNLIVRLGDVAEIREGSATRFGAITANGEGEKVLGQVMMLKGSNSNEVIKAVNERVQQISGSLPPGIRINGFLERSKLISKTTTTIAENLILGFLIVMFVVVLLLGNWRSGLLVASVIPLSLLFAISMMYLFHIDANLMSLGAIDFGIIIDGTVIIVEYVAFQISRNAAELGLLAGKPLRRRMDEITGDATQKLSRSALFGQLIIIIVFIPILSLTGIEGKMFRPMAQVFVAALVGAMIFGFTYVPVMSALFLKPGGGHSLATRLIALLNKAYVPSINWALNHKKLVLGAALAVLLATGVQFVHLGAEFVPTLDEGDFVIQPVFKTGTTLSETIGMTTKIETILKSFPEVDQVVSRIGAAEVPTDPMSMEESDIIITLKPRKEWVTAKTKDELADAFKEALNVFPGVEIEFTQPIEMRFNELITGTRADVAIKIFGEDLEMLNNLAQRIKILVEDVEGIGDIVVEKTTGLPEYLIRLNRSQLARYGLTTDEANKVISIAFAGLKAGEVLEGERRFDLVLRYDKPFRKNDIDLANIMVPVGGGLEIPLSELAEIVPGEGPAKISRDNARRRVVVGINVRGRDMESVVQDVQQRISSSIVLPEGFTIAYGGQFENLRMARQRLSIAIPVALLLIFIMLHLAFGNFRDAILIFTAIPMAVVGGVWLLWLRGMPFSISAGVGFIALFGVAVLNGIVLIEHYHALSAKGITDLRTLIVRGASERMRPVLLTAMAAALGFLPMAISQSAGAEVQRPLATVVIGGLFTSTFLTLIVLPVLYCVIIQRSEKMFMSKKSIYTIILLMLVSSTVPAQSPGADLAVERALANNPGHQAIRKQLEAAEAAIPLALSPEKPIIYYSLDKNNLASNDLPLNVWGISQQIAWPGLITVRHQLAKTQYEKATLMLQKSAASLELDVRLAYNDWQYRHALQQIYERLSGIEKRVLELVTKRVDEGALTRLELLMAQANYNEIALALSEAGYQTQQSRKRLEALIGTDLDLPAPDSLVPMPFPDTASHQGVWNVWSDNLLKHNKLLLKSENRQWLPDLELEYFSGTNKLLHPTRIDGFKIGLSLPLWLFPATAQYKTGKLQMQSLELQLQQAQRLYDLQFFDLKQNLKMSGSHLRFARQQSLDLASKIENTALLAYENGDADLDTYLMALSKALKIRRTFSEAIHQYNKSVLEYMLLPIVNTFMEQ